MGLVMSNVVAPVVDVTGRELTPVAYQTPFVSVHTRHLHNTRRECSLRFLCR